MLERTWKKIISNKRFSLWSVPAFFLWLASFGYRGLFLLKRSRSTETVRLKVPVIAVGNLSVGGSGKTPMVGCIAADLIDEGYAVGIVSSGYKRKSSEAFVEPGYHIIQRKAEETGDEVMLLAVNLPEAMFSVDDSKTVAARRLAETADVDVIIVDDAYQHFTLERDLNIVTYDAGVKKRELKLFPRGILREPLSALQRSDIIIITRSNFARDLHKLINRLQRFNPKADIYHAAFSADEIVGREQRRSVKYLEDKSVFLFAGIGNFRALERQVGALAADVDYAMELSDHQEYDQELLEEIKKRADGHESDLILTTAKDWVKLGDFDFGREIYYLNLRVDLDPGEEKLIQSIEDRLGLQKQEE
jgi:tetraacyldisaccharide 4'-kinase